MKKGYGLFLFAVVLMFVSTAAYAVPVGCMGGAGQDSAKAAQLSATNLDAAFAAASKEFGVPVEILKAVGKVETNLTQSGPSIDFGYGVMHLVDNSYASTLKEAAALTGISADTLKADAAANIRGAAALIAKYAKETVGKPKSSKDYFAALKKFSALYSDQLQETQADSYFKAMGVDVSGLLKPTVAIKSADYGPALWVASPNYNSRSGTAIDRWVNHWIGTGTYAGAISWFQNPAAQVSAHFVCRNSDGQLTQMVTIANRAWHCGTWNSRSIGIEHEATTNGAYLWTSANMKQASADACRYFCDQKGIPKTRSYIIGHKESAGASTACPGNLPWDDYMARVNPSSPSYAAHWTNQSYTSTMTSGTQAIVWLEYQNDGTATWDITNTRVGTTNPRDRSSAFFMSGNWIGANRPSAVDYGTGPGAVGRFTWIMLAPTVSTPTVYTEYWGLLQEAVTWFGPADGYVWFQVTVNPVAGTPTPTNTPTRTPTVTPTPRPEIIMDDGDAGFSLSGAWTYTTGGGTEPLNADYQWASTTTGASGKYAQWQPTLGPGNYEIYVRYRVGTNRAVDAPYTVVYNGGSATVDVNQTINGGVYVSIGTYNFAAGSSGYVRLDNGPATASKVVIADAVKFTPR